MSYRIEVAAAAARHFKKLPREIQVRLTPRINALAGDPRSAGAEKLTDQDHLYRIREGDYRILYQIRDETLLVLVVDVGDRKDIYRRLR